MSETTSIARRPNVATVMAQAAIGYIAAMFLLILARTLLVYDDYSIVYVFLLPVVFVFAIVLAVPAGLFVWAGFEIAGDTLNQIYRSVIAVVIMAPAILYLFMGVIAATPPTHEQIWVLALLLVPAMGIGLVTGSRLRLWRELVRGGDRVGAILRGVAGVTGVMLRVKVVFLFMASTIAVICTLQSTAPEFEPYRAWSILMFAHFAGAVALVLARVKGDVLVPLGVIVNAPVVAALVKSPAPFPAFPYLVIGYLALWTVFLLTRWRQTPAAFSALNEEFRYYLID